MNNKTNKVFMAFAKGQESKEAGSIKKYVGVGSVFVTNVNPSKAELEALYGVTLEKDPEYVSTATIQIPGGEKQVPQVRLDFIVKTDPEKNNGIDTTTKASFFLRKEYRFNKDQSKVQIIDIYGRTAWVTKEELKNKSIPQYSNGPANIDPDYRPCYIGEEELTNFIKDYLNIPNPQNYVDGKWVNKPKEEMDNAQARLDKVEQFFTGDVKELKTILSFQPKNKVKCAFYIKVTSDNREYQSIYTQKFLRNGVREYSRLKKDVEDRQAAGALVDAIFSFEELKEYTIEPTNFNSTVTDDPFASVGQENDPWK